MKFTRKTIAAALLLAFLLSVVGLTAPAAEALDGPEAETKAADGLFRAQFEGEGVEGSGEAVDGVYRIAAAKTDGEAWHIKLESNYPTVAGRDYRVTYRFRSDVAGKVKLGDFREYEIREGENEITGMMIAAGGTTYLDLQLGMLPPFTIDFTEVEVEEFADEAEFEDALSAPIDFEKESKVYETHDQDYDAVLTRTADEVSVNYVAASRESGIWKSRLYVKTGLIPESGAHYRITADVTADRDMPFELLFNKGDEEKGYGALYGQKLSAGETKTVEAVLTGGDGDELVLQFSLGEAPEGSTVKVGAVRVEKIRDHYTQLLPAHFALDEQISTGRMLTSTIPFSYTNLDLKNFSYSSKDTVYVQADDGYVVDLQEAASSATLKISQAPAEGRGVWKVRLYAATGVTLEAGKTYRLKLDVKSTGDQAEYEVVFDGNKEEAYGALKRRSLTAGGTDSIEYLLTPDESRGALTVRLQLGKTDSTAGNTVTLSNLSLETVSTAATDLGAVSYVTDVNVWENIAPEFGMEQKASASGSSASLTVTKASSEPAVWHSRFFIATGVTLEPNSHYRVTADVSSDKAIDEFELLNDNGGAENGYGGEVKGLSAAAGGTTAVSADIHTPAEGCGQLVLRFQLGKSPADNTVTVSNIQVCKVTDGESAGSAYRAYKSTVSEGSFALEANNDTVAELSGDGSSVTAKVITPHDGWEVKFYVKPGVELETGKTYQISFNAANADGCEVCFKNANGSGEEGFGKTSVSGGAVNYSFTAAETGTLEILLKIGGLPAGTKVTLSSVKLEEGTSAATNVSLSGFAYPVTTPAALKVDADHHDVWSGSFGLEANNGTAAELSGGGSSASAKVITGASAGDGWEIKMYVKPEVELQAGKTYRVSFNAAGGDGAEVCFKNCANGQEKGFGATNVSSGRVSYEIRPETNGKMEILLKLARLAADTVVTVSGVQLEEAGYPMTGFSYPNTTQTADAEHHDVWSGSFGLEANNGTAAELSGDGSSAATAKVITGASAGDGWEIKMYVKPEVELQAGKTYRVSFNAAGGDGAEVCFKNCTSGQENGFGATSVSSGRVSYEIAAAETGKMEILLKLARLAPDTVVTVSGVQLEEIGYPMSGFSYPSITGSDTTPNSFELTADGGATASLTGNGTSATATVDTPAADYNVKLYAKPGVELQAGKTYRVSFQAENANGCPVCFKNINTGNEEGFGTTSVSSGSVSYDIAAAETGTMQILMKIGALPAGTAVKVSDVKLEEIESSLSEMTLSGFAYPTIAESGEETPETVGENLMNASLRAGATVSCQSSEAYAANLSSTASSASLAVTAAPDSGRETYNLKLLLDTGKTLSAGKTYRVSADVASTSELDYGIFYGTAANENCVGEKDDLHASASATTAVAEFTPSADAALVLQFRLGNAGAGDTITVSNVKVEELSVGEPTNVIPSFSYDSTGSISTMAGDGYITELEQSGSSATFRILQAPAERNAWDARLIVNTGVSPSKGKGLRVSFDVESAKPQGLLEVFFDGDEELAYGALYEQTLPGGKKSFSYTIKPGDKGTLVLQLRPGKTDGTDGNTYTFSNLKIEEVAFTTTSTPEIKTVTELVTQKGYVSRLEKSRDSASVRIEKTPAEGCEAWKSKLFVETGVSLREGQKYRISMDVKSDAPTPFEVCFNNGGEEKGLGAMYDLIATPSGLHVEYVTYAKQNADLVLQLSLGNCTAPNTVVLSNVSVEKAGKIIPVSDTIYTF